MARHDLPLHELTPDPASILRVDKGRSFAWTFVCLKVLVVAVGHPQLVSER